MHTHKHCLTCQADSGAAALCSACRSRARQIWYYERTVAACPNPDCGWSPLADEGLLTMFPTQASIANDGDLIIVVFGAQGCHRCAAPNAVPSAEIYRLRPS